MPNYFDYISESAERYEEPEFVEESVSDSFDETIADMDLHCFQESLIVAGAVIGIAALITLLIVVIKRALDGRGGSGGLKQQNKKMKKAIDALEKAGVEGVECRPKGTGKNDDTDVSPKNRAVGDADYAYLNSSKNKTNSGAINLQGERNYDDYKTKHAESKLSGAEKFGGNVARPIWERPISLIDKSSNSAFNKMKDDMNEFIIFATQLFEACENVAPMTRAEGMSNGEKEKILKEIKRTRAAVDKCDIKKIDVSLILKIQIGYTPTTAFRAHTDKIDEIIKELDADLKKLKLMQDTYTKHNKGGKNKTNSPWQNDTEGNNKFKKNVATCDFNVSAIQAANAKTVSSIDRLRLAEAAGHAYNYKRAN